MSFAATGYRWADYDTPLWVSPNRSAGRWHQAGDDPTQYWALHPAGPWAEYLRAHAIRDPGDADEICSRTWVAEFTFENEAVANISFATAADWGVTAADLVDDDPTVCRGLAHTLRRDYQALVVPSAALPGTTNLVVFGARVIAPYGGPVIDPRLDVSAAPTADHARPPSALLALVRHRGLPHAGLAAWRGGLPEPIPAPLW